MLLKFKICVNCHAKVSYIFTTLQWTISSNQVSECLWFELHYPKKPPILVGEFYRPPNSKADFFEEFDKTLDYAVSQNMSCIILGDFFNCNSMPDQQHDCNAQKLLFYADMYGLNQLIHNATRVTNTTSTTIDLIFVTDKELYRETGIFRTSISDHYLIYTCTIRDFNANLAKKNNMCWVPLIQDFRWRQIFRRVKKCTMAYMQRYWKHWSHLGDLVKIVHECCWQTHSNA